MPLIVLFAKNPIKNPIWKPAMTIEPQIVRSEQDSAWKEILDAYFTDFITYCLPKLDALIDWSIPYVSLDKEFQAITKGTDAGKRLLDKLFKVHLKDGREQWILVHVEVQGKPDEDFPKRMFSYGYRIYDRYQRPVVSCAILTDSKKKWRPNSYQVGLADSYLRANFLTIKLLDYQNERSRLEVSSNPFASVILVQLMALEAKNKPEEQKMKVKFALTKRLYEKGFPKKAVIHLYKFIDWLIGLPKPLEIQYIDEVYQLEESSKMPYISFAERFGMEKGMEKGIKKGIEQVAIHMLEEGAKIAFIKKTTRLTLKKIKQLQQDLKEKQN